MNNSAPEHLRYLTGDTGSQTATLYYVHECTRRPTMSRRHTEGEWTVWPDHELGMDRSDEIVVGMASGAIIATVWPFGDDEVGINEAIANAYLIAGAPKLLAAAKGMLDHMGYVNAAGEWTLRDDHPLSVLRAAILSAEPSDG